eukprot:13559575-Heterocapsa_arctica.AAC.1
MQLAESCDALGHKGLVVRGTASQTRRGVRLQTLIMIGFARVQVGYWAGAPTGKLFYEYAPTGKTLLLRRLARFKGVV